MNIAMGGGPGGPVAAVRPADGDGAQRRGRAGGGTFVRSRSWTRAGVGADRVV